MNVPVAPDRGPLTLVARACELAIWGLLIAYAALVLQGFYGYVDRLVYLSADDSLANVAYLVGTEGRYGFLASPILLYMPRHHGLFSYGPWYFYIGGALVWMFGYSLTLVRSIHPWVIVFATGAAAAWFRPRAVLAAGIFGFAALYCFDVAQWPMARPDVVVSAFAIALVICVGLAWERRRAGYWILAGFAASSGATTHLVAWSLIPVSLLLCCVAVWDDVASGADRSAAWRRAVLHFVALLFGLTAGAAVFYHSFGFQFAIELRFLTGYRNAIASADPFFTVIGRHFDLAFAYLKGAGPLLGLALALALVTLVAAIRAGGDARRRAYRDLLPPIAVWVGYAISLGTYRNYHKGYGILLQLIAFWIVGALVSFALVWLASRRPRAATVASLVVAGVIVWQGWDLVAGQLANGAARSGVRREWVTGSSYTREINGLIPAGSTAWGSIMFGIENPGRVQLVQWLDAVTVLERGSQTHRISPDLAPDYVVWGYSENRDDFNLILATNNQGGNVFGRLAEYMPDSKYRLVGLVTAAPYGTTRIYARTVKSDKAPSPLPVVSVYDQERGTWDRRLDGPVDVKFATASPVGFAVGYTPVAVPVKASRSVVGDLPAGRFLLRVRLTRTQAQAGRKLVLTTVPVLHEVVGELGAAEDSTPYAGYDDEAYLIAQHPGGPLYVSQFENGADASIAGIEVYRIVAALDEGERPPNVNFVDFPAFTSWIPSQDVHMTVVDAGVLAVEGDTTMLGYQIISPQIPAPVGAHVLIHSTLMAERGQVCFGALNATDTKWLVPAAERQQDLTLTIDQTAGFRVVVANCNASVTSSPSRFTIAHPRYAIESGALYVDRLMTEMQSPAVPIKPSVEGVRVFPDTLRLTSDDLARVKTVLHPPDFEYRAPITSFIDDIWTIKGTADARYSYLLQSKPQAVTGDMRLLVTGRVVTGGVTVGLLKNSQWDGQVNVNKQGEFTAVIEPSGPGPRYIVIANYLPGDSLLNIVSITKVAWLTR